MILDALLAAVGQIGDRRFRWVLVRGVGLTLALLAALYALTFWGVSWLVPETLSLPFIGQVHFVGALLSWGSLALMILLSVFLMVPVASAFTGLFLDEIADAVEDRHYPGLPPALQIGWGEALRESLGFLGVLVAANLFALIAYLLFVPIAPFIFYALNGYLLGREYFGMIARRRLGRDAASAAFRQNLAPIWATGALMAVPLTLPLVNLVMPVLGAATFTHLFHRLQRNRAR